MELIKEDTQSYQTSDDAGDKSEAQIVETIYQAVLEQRLTPGAKLSESELCDLFQVRRMRVRRALLLLSARGIVDLQPNKGAFIASYTPDKAVEIFNARLLLETSIVTQLANRITRAQIQQLEAHIAQEALARQLQNQTEQVRLSGLFHVKLTQLLGNQVLTDMVRDLVTRTSLIVARFGTASDGHCCNEDEHLALSQALGDGDDARAQQLMTDHLNHIQNALVFAEKRQNQNSLRHLIS